jgi:hypothetical protein
MVGLATLTRSIGVRIPGGQPRHVGDAVSVTGFEFPGGGNLINKSFILNDLHASSMGFTWSHPFTPSVHVGMSMRCVRFELDSRGSPVEAASCRDRQRFTIAVLLLQR